MTPFPPRDPVYTSRTSIFQHFDSFNISWIKEHQSVSIRILNRHAIHQIQGLCTTFKTIPSPYRYLIITFFHDCLAMAILRVTVTPANRP